MVHRRIVVVSALTACAVSALTVVLLGFDAPPVAADACLVGDIRARELAYVAPELRTRHFDARDIALGVGTAAVGDWASLGDAVSVGGQLWVRSTNVQSPRFYRPIHNPYFLSNHFVYVPRDRAPATEMAIGAQSLAALSERLPRANGGGVLFGGYVRFASLHSIALARAPIRGAAIAQHVPRYYVQPMETLHDAWAFVVGIGADTADGTWARAVTAGTGGYVHALVVADAPVDFSAPPRPADVIGVGQVVATSLIDRGQLRVYPLKRLRDCTSAPASPSPAPLLLTDARQQRE